MELAIPVNVNDVHITGVSQTRWGGGGGGLEEERERDSLELE